MKMLKLLSAITIGSVIGMHSAMALPTAGGRIKEGKDVAERLEKVERPVYQGSKEVKVTQILGKAAKLAGKPTVFKTNSGEEKRTFGASGTQLASVINSKAKEIEITDGENKTKMTFDASILMEYFVNLGFRVEKLKDQVEAGSEAEKKLLALEMLSRVGIESLPMVLNMSESADGRSAVYKQIALLNFMESWSAEDINSHLEIIVSTLEKMTGPDKKSDVALLETLAAKFGGDAAAKSKMAELIKCLFGCKDGKCAAIFFKS
jgi:hypothetical protein